MGLDCSRVFLHNLNLEFYFIINNLMSHFIHVSIRTSLFHSSRYFFVICASLQKISEESNIYFSRSGTERVYLHPHSMYSQKLLIASYSSKSLCNFSEESPRAYGPSQDKQRQLLKLAVSCKIH